METNKKILGKINTQRCSVTLTLSIYLKGKAQQLNTVMSDLFLGIPVRVIEIPVNKKPVIYR
jgi:hypothetical protein